MPKALTLQENLAAFVQDIAVVPARFCVVNLDTQEEVEAQRNPPSFEDEIGAEYQRLATPGQSHQRHHFVHTNNYTVNIDLRFRAYSEEEYVEMNRARHLLFSWAYPIDHSPGGAPKLLATWPNAFSIECKLISCRFRNERFMPTGAIVDWTASLVFEETRDRRLTSRQVAQAIIVRGMEVDVVDMPPPTKRSQSGPKPKPRTKPGTTTPEAPADDGGMSEMPTEAEYQERDEALLRAFDNVHPLGRSVAVPYQEAAYLQMNGPAGPERSAALERLVGDMKTAVANARAEQAEYDPNAPIESSGDGPNQSEEFPNSSGGNT